MEPLAESDRPGTGSWGAISVVIPFAGSAADADRLAEAVASLELDPADELIVADNGSRGRALACDRLGELARVVSAAEEPSSYYARNRGAEQAGGEWLLFIDADCIPEAGLLAAFRSPGPPDPRLGVVAGAVVGLDPQPGLIPGYARSRGQLSERWHVEVPDGAPGPAGIGGNLLVRRSAFEELGGFHEGVRSGADVELCWRLQDAGWAFDHRPAARVAHRHVTSLRALVAQASRHAAGRLWLTRRYAGCFPPPPPLGPARALAGAALELGRLRPRRAVHRILDAIWRSADLAGWLLGSNRVGGDRPAAATQIWTDAYPARSETFISSQVETLDRAGTEIEVISSARPLRTERSYARAHRISYLEDYSPRHKFTALVRLLARHPVRTMADRRRRASMLAEEPTWPLAALAPALIRTGPRPRHLHAHFAAIAAGNSMRAAALLGSDWSLSTHAYDVFQQPRNLPAKLGAARFTTAECEHVATVLAELAPAGSGPIELVRTGVDFRFFTRRAPRPGVGRILAVGRLVEKKGFETLVAAAAILGRLGVAGRIEICGDGPLRPQLLSQIAELPDGAIPVELRGNVWGRAAVRAELEHADLLAIPARLAADGDRDALPLIAYEAVAMEVPVVASELVGLPEVVRPPWGRTVVPSDPELLAASIAEVLALEGREADAAAAEGRRFVVENANASAWAHVLGSLIGADRAAAAQSSSSLRSSSR